MSLATRREGDRIVIAVTGDLDMVGAPQLVLAADAALAVTGVSGIDIDLSIATFLDSSGINALIVINRAAAAQSKTLVVLTPGIQARKVLRLTSVDSVLTIEPPSAHT